ncbi:MAG: hypothetical protein ACI92S_004412, partial [Planctomycetaceae bacterium]
MSWGDFISCPMEYHTSDLQQAVERLVEPTERGDPQSPLRWTCKSLSNLQAELNAQGYQIGRTKIAGILKGLGYSLQGNRKGRNRRSSGRFGRAWESVDI